MDIVNLSEMEPDWNWLSKTVVHTEPLHWRHASTRSVAVPVGLPRPATYQRAVAAWRAAAMLEAPSSLLVSHGPRMTMYGALALTSRLRARRHLAYAFNFTELPQGALKAVMGRAFRRVDRFVCFSTMERQLYADHFDLDLERFDMIHWAARSPMILPRDDLLTPAPYLCAIGSQGRDYETLLAAMARVPEARLVLVATPESLGDLPVPGNVEVRCNIPVAEAMGVLQGARFNVVPLRGSAVPCGHVTIVSAMHCEKPSIVSRSSGIADYVWDDVNGMTVPPGDPAALAACIGRLWRDPTRVAQLGSAAKVFARDHCGESTAVAYFEHYIGRQPRIALA